MYCRLFVPAAVLFEDMDADTVEPPKHIKYSIRVHSDNVPPTSHDTHLYVIALPCCDVIVSVIEVIRRPIPFCYMYRIGA